MTDQPDIREQLAAFLAGELDGPAAQALQDRIDAEPWVAGLADEMADLLVALGGVDHIEPPTGFSAVLRAGLEARIGHPLPAVEDRPAESRAMAGGALPASGPRTRRDGPRPQMASGGRVRRALSIAAVLAALGIGTIGVVTGLRGSGGSSDVASSDDGGVTTLDAARTGEESMTLEADPTAGEGAAPADDAAGAVVEEDGPPEALQAEEGGQAAEDGAITSAPAHGAPDAPAVLDLGRVDDEQVLLDAVAGQPVVDTLLGRPAADARELADAYRDQLLRGPSFPDGTPPGACLTEVLDAAGDDLVAAVALRADLASGAAVAYALVTARDGQGEGAVLDGVDVWVLQLDGCATQQVLRQR